MQGQALSRSRIFHHHHQPSIARSTLALAMLRTLVRRAAERPRSAFDINNNPYKAKRVWPPDFSKLPPKHQFRLERKYRRRSQLKWARPRWNKFVKLAQWATISCTHRNTIELW